MPTIPTNKMERELRALYLRWLRGLSYDSSNLPDKINAFERQSLDLIERLGGQTASLGALADFPVPKRLDLSPRVGTIYSDMQQAAIQAGIIAGQQSTDTARKMFNAGMDKSFNRLNRLARTETTNAYWQNAFNSIADLPLLVMVWGSEDGPRTCPWCRERDGMVMEDSNLRDHPNGRCTPIPMLRSQVEYRGSVRSDGQIYYDDSWDKAKVKATSDPRPEPILEPEEEFVARITGMLQQGQLTTAQLEAQLSTAKPLSQLNARTAIARYQAELEAKRQAAIQPPPAPFRVAKRDLPAPSQEVQDALKPKRSYLVSTHKETVGILNKTPDGKALLQTMKPFQSGGSTAIPRLRTDIEKYLRGESLPAGRVSAIEQLLGATKSIPAPTKPLYRGMVIPGSVDDVLARYAPGTNVDLSLASFTSDRKTGIEFSTRGAGQAIKTKKNTAVLVEWDQEVKTALPIENISPSRVFQQEKEWVTSGQFKVASVETKVINGVPTVIVKMVKEKDW